MDGPLEKFFRYQIPCMIFFRPQHEYFLGVIGVHEFFSFNFPLREYFSVLRPPPPHKFSNGPSVITLSFCIQTWYVSRCRETAQVSAS